ncbi:hypothetical protein FS837_008041 [Tulasnella sp. UAMH 9824]|nr:hypothetical protein FS837_008041 [Tulasnella sp. UAMH 9824]
MTNVEWVIELGTECIEWARQGSRAILIRNDTKFENETLRDHFNGIKPGSFEKQMRNYGYQKKKTTTGHGSLWVLKDQSLPDDPTQLGMALETPSLASAPTAASMGLKTSTLPDLKARMDELEDKLDTTTSELIGTQLELNDTRTELKETRKLLSETMSEVQILTKLLRRVFARDTAEPVSSGDCPSHSVPDSGPGPVVSQDPPHINHPNGYGGALDGSSLNKPQASPFGATAPRGAPLGPDIGLSCNPADPTLPSEQPTHPQLSSYGTDANPGIPQIHPARHTVPGGPFQQVFLVQQSGFTTMPQDQGAGTSSRRYQSSLYGTGGSYQYGPPTSSPPVTSTPPASTRTQPLNHFGVSAGPRRQTGVASVPRMPNPNTSNYVSQSQFPR